MKLALAPMEGLIDEHMRAFLTRDRAFDHCVTEFLRISDQLLPKRVFQRICPEHRNDWKTPSGTPVHLQLLGSDPLLMAQNARRGALLGAPVIDVNFGCPSKTVNSNRGGSVLLQDPQEIYDILIAMRQAIPPHVPLTAKMRLGYEDKSLALDNALAMEAAGIDALCIHARTKVEGYKPPAHWQWIAKIKEQVKIPVTANGEIWTLEDYKKCQQVSGCDDIMLGRGAVASPNLALQIKSLAAGKEIKIGDWHTRLHDMLQMIRETIDCGNSKFAAGRIKQWLVYLQRGYPEASPFFQRAKRVKTSLQMIELLKQEIADFNGHPT
ncbi:MAG: tRNA-dihydrouridine synthase [Bermanella sp.]